MRSFALFLMMFGLLFISCDKEVEMVGTLKISGVTDTVYIYAAENTEYPIASYTPPSNEGIPLNVGNYFISSDRYHAGNSSSADGFQIRPGVTVHAHHGDAPYNNYWTFSE